MTLVWSPGYAPVDEYYDSVSLLLYGNGTNGSTTITDSSPSPKTMTAVGNAQISTAQSKFGGASIAFDGTGDYLTVPDSADWDMPNDFTIEAWVYLAAYSTAWSGVFGAAIVCSYNFIEGGGDPGWQLRINGTASSYTTINVYTGLTDLNFAATVSLNTWTHVAVTRSGSSIRAFVNGTQAGSTITNSDAFTENGSRPLWIGGLNDPTYRFWLNGYIDDLRITKGVARYTSNFTPPTASFPDLSPTGRLTVAYTIDSDAAAYIAAVEAADGQALETATRTAIDSFVKGCKNDGIWNAIKASCILAGARTLAGALVPLVGTAPTNVGPFVSGDYNRETGLVGDGSTKYLNSNRNNNADPQNSSHISVWVSSLPSAASYYLAGDWIAGNTIGIIYDPGSTRERWGNKSFEINQATSNTHTSTGLKATNRNSSSTFFARTNGATVVPTVFDSGSLVSVAPASHDVYIFARNGTSGVAVALTNARLAFYSIGESLDLAQLDTRVTTLINAFAAAIP